MSQKITLEWVPDPSGRARDEVVHLGKWRIARHFSAASPFHVTVGSMRRIACYLPGKKVTTETTGGKKRAREILEEKILEWFSESTLDAEVSFKE